VVDGWVGGCGGGEVIFAPWFDTVLVLVAKWIETNKINIQTPPLNGVNRIQPRHTCMLVMISAHLDIIASPLRFTSDA
jgi:hypothetical protein